MNPFDQGYRDQLNGGPNPLREFASVTQSITEKDAAAYRSGARCCRSDLVAENDAIALSRETGLANPGPIPDWSRRLMEFRGTPGAGIVNNFPNGDKLAYVPEVARVVSTTEGFVALTDVREGQAVALDDLGTMKRAAPTPNAFAEPEPGAKKAKRPKPVDEGQGTFL